MDELLSEFEDLLKIRKFGTVKRLQVPYLCTYEKISKALKDEYQENIDDRVSRWIDVTHVQYFENVKPVTYYFQAKMLYRDGFYESAIMLCRSISEMICYELLNRSNHPFGDLNLIEVAQFRIYVDFLYIPKTISKNEFVNDIVAKLSGLEEKNFIKGSYGYNKLTNTYHLKNEIAKERKNLNRFLKIFLETGYTSKGLFSSHTYKLFHEIYDIGNIYVHSKVTNGNPKEDAKKVILMLTQILSDVFGSDSGLEGKLIKSGYTEFPDICKGLNFAMEFGLTPEAAHRVFYNLPSEKDYSTLKKIIGSWNGKWRNGLGVIEQGCITFRLEPEDMIYADLEYKSSDGEQKIEPVEIRLFEGYFHLIVFDSQTKFHDKEVHPSFELEIFEDEMLLGKSLQNSGNVIFEKRSC